MQAARVKYWGTFRGVQSMEVEYWGGFSGVPLGMVYRGTCTMDEVLRYVQGGTYTRDGVLGNMHWGQSFGVHSQGYNHQRLSIGVPSKGCIDSESISRCTYQAFQGASKGCVYSAGIGTWGAFTRDGMLGGILEGRILWGCRTGLYSQGIESWGASREVHSPGMGTGVQALWMAYWDASRGVHALEMKDWATSSGVYSQGTWNSGAYSMDTQPRSSPALQHPPTT